MDPILSFLAPGLSFLAIPALASYTTSLNLVFFYLTWSTLLLSHSELKVEAIGTLAVRLIFYLAPAYFFLLFDAAVPSIAAATKEHGELGIATAQAGRRWRNITLVSTGNLALGIVLQLAVEILLTRVLHVKSALKVTTTLPFPYALAKDLLKAFLAREILAYCLHRFALHHDKSPLRLRHRRFYHSLEAPFSLTAHYDHPLAYLVRVWLPTYLPAVIFRFHVLTYFAFLALVSLEELFVYSGYAVLPTGLVLGGMARRHERHIMAGVDGNYGAYGLIDLLAGTGLGNHDLIDDVREEAEKRDLEGRGKIKAKEVQKRVRKLRDRAQRASQE